MPRHLKFAHTPQLMSVWHVKNSIMTNISYKKLSSDLRNGSLIYEFIVRSDFASQLTICEEEIFRRTGDRVPLVVFIYTVVWGWRIQPQVC